MPLTGWRLSSLRAWAALRRFQSWPTPWAAARIGRPDCSPISARGRWSLLTASPLDRLHARDELDAVLAEPLPVRELLFRLDDLDRRVLELRLGFVDGEPRSFADTARVLQISVTRVRRIEARALETLRGFCPQQASALL